MEFFDKIIDTFSKKIDYVRRASMGVPKTLVINLALPIIDQPYHISGNLYYVWSAPRGSDYVDIKVNKSSEPALRCVCQTGLITPFDKLLITTPDNEQTGDMVILYGTEAPELLSIIDNRNAVIAGQADILSTLTTILDQVRGDVTDDFYGGVTVTAAPGATLLMAFGTTRAGGIIQALSTNTGSVFLGYDVSVTVGGAPGTWFAELQPGMSFTFDNYRGLIYGIAAAQQVVGTGEW